MRPYRCKFSDKPECNELRFSSNACLLRHEREAHGEHRHGVNPYLCLFTGCERSREGMGFPRRWNRRDHMKRVHQYEEDEAPSKKGSISQSLAKRRKPSTMPVSTPMRRSTSSTAAKVQAMSNVQANYYGAVSRTSYDTPATYAFQNQDYNMLIPQPAAMFDLQYSQLPMAISRTPRTSPSYTQVYPA